MPTYLLTWNPKRWEWNDIQDRIDEIEDAGYYIGSWSVGVSQKIKQGDRLFLIRLGKEPKGIIGAGWAESNVYSDAHWDEEKRANGDSANYIDVRFDSLLNPQAEKILSRKELEIDDLVKQARREIFAEKNKKPSE